VLLHFTTKVMPGRALILLLGDSITQLSFSAINAGWGAHLADQYQRRADGKMRFSLSLSTTVTFGCFHTDFHFLLHFFEQSSTGASPATTPTGI
jgi:hypothetical protein